MRAFLITLCVLIQLNLAAQIPPRPLPRNQVNDLAGVLDDSARTAALEYKLRKLSDSVNIEVIAVTVKQIRNKTSLEYTQALAKEWEDDKEKKVAVFILIDVDDRDFAIVTGSDYSAKMDEFICRKIEEQYLKPYFVKEEYYEGFNSAALAVVNHITGKLTDETLKSDDQNHVFLFLAIAVLLGLIISFYYLLSGIQSNSLGSKPMGFSSAFMILSNFRPLDSTYADFEKGTGKFKTKVTGSDLVNFGGGSWGSW